MSNDYELFKGKNLSSLFEDIYNNQLSKKSKISGLIEELKKMIRHAGDVASVGPIISSLIDIQLHNLDRKFRIVISNNIFILYYLSNIFLRKSWIIF